MSKSRSIYEYDNYRTYLKDLYLEAKSRGRKFSFQYFSRLLGFSSTSFFKHVIDGQRNLSEESIERFSKVFKLNQQEAYFFKNLVFLNQAKTAEEKNGYSREILRSRAYRKTHPLKEAQLDYFTQWYFVVIREMVNLPSFREDPDWIATNTEPAISPRQAKDALDELFKLGLLARNEDGKVVQSNTIVVTTDEVISPSLAQYHKEFMKKAGESIDTISREKRDISSVTFRVSEQTAKKIKEKIQKFRIELAEEASRDLNPEAIYQLNLQLFPVTRFFSNKVSEDDPK